METLEKIVTILTVLVLVAVIGGLGYFGYALSHLKHGPAFGDISTPLIIGSGATNSSVSIQNASTTQILAGSSGRQAATICNIVATSTWNVFLSIGAAAANNQGILLAPQKCVTFGLDYPLYTQAINGWSQSGTSSVSITYAQ